MERKKRANDAAVKDVRTTFRKEECATGMEQRLNTNDAAVKDVQTKLRMEECAKNMGQRSNYAPMKGV